MPGLMPSTHHGLMPSTHMWADAIEASDANEAGDANEDGDFEAFFDAWDASELG